MQDLGGMNGHFGFFAVITPDGKIPTIDDDSNLNDSSRWYTGPIATLAHLSDYVLVFTDWDDASAEYQKHREELPPGTRIRAFSVEVEEIEDADELDEIEIT